MHDEHEPEATAIPPRPMRSVERETRDRIASFLYCEAFELRYRPDVARVVSGLAARVASSESIPDMLANAGATGRGSPYAALRKPDALRALIERRAIQAYTRAVSRLLGVA